MKNYRFEDLEQIAKRKISIAFNRELTQQEEQEYLVIFINDMMNNIAYSRGMLNNYLREI